MLTQEQINEKKAIYEAQLIRLTQFPEEIYDSWNDYEGFFESRRGLQVPGEYNDDYACITQCRHFNEMTSDKFHPLVNELIEDGDIPMLGENIEVKHLEKIKKWAERFDAAGIV